MKLGIIGAGNMASAIVKGILKKQVFSPDEILIYDICREKVLAFEKRGLTAAMTPSSLAAAAELILVAVKPQQIDDVLSELYGYTGGKCIVSIVAGISTDYYKKKLGADTYVIRVMPNTPILLGCGATAIARNTGTPQDLYDKAVSVFSSAGEVAFVDEEHMNAVTGVNGSSPAYFFVMAKAMASCAAEQGIDMQTALRLAAKSMEGAAVMLLKSGKTPDELTAAVTSPGGTTLAALEEMQKRGFSEAIRSGMLACTRRAAEIGK